MPWSLALRFSMSVLTPESTEPRDLTEVVEWEGPSPCPGASALQLELEALVPAGARIPAGLHIRGRVTGSDGDWSLALGVTSPSGTQTRVFRSDDCADLVTTAAVVAASWLLEQPQETLPEAPPVDPRPRPIAAPENEPAAPPALVAPRPPSRTRTFHGRLSLRAETRIGRATLPNLDALLGLALAWSARAGRLEASARHGFRQRHDTGTPGAGIDLHVTSAVLRGCGVPSWGRIGVPLCGGLELGALTGRGRGASVRESQRRVDLYGAFEVSTHLRVRLHSRVHLWFGAELVVPFRRPRFVVLGATPFTPLSLGGRGSVGLEITLSPPS